MMMMRAPVFGQLFGVCQRELASFSSPAKALTFTTLRSQGWAFKY